MALLMIIDTQITLISFMRVLIVDEFWNRYSGRSQNSHLCFVLGHGRNKLVHDKRILIVINASKLAINLTKTAAAWEGRKLINKLYMYLAVNLEGVRPSFDYLRQDSSTSRSPSQ